VSDVLTTRNLYDVSGGGPMLSQVNQNLQPIRVEEILDREHLEIKRNLQDSRTAIIEGLGMERIVSSSKQLVCATLDHFKSEELAMNADKFRTFAVHRRKHAEMIESLEEISSDLEQLMIRGALELIKLFDSRLIYHLDVEDAELERELKS
jgi:hemerythrin-like metal-binding protein